MHQNKPETPVPGFYREHRALLLGCREQGLRVNLKAQTLTQVQRCEETVTIVPNYTRHPSTYREQ